MFTAAIFGRPRHKFHYFTIVVPSVKEISENFLLLWHLYIYIKLPLIRCKWWRCLVSCPTFLVIQVYTSDFNEDCGDYMRNGYKLLKRILSSIKHRKQYWNGSKNGDSI